MDWKRKLTSRKFWTTVAEFVTMLMIAMGETQDTATKVAALIMGGAAVIAYIIGEGLIDAAGAKETVYHAAGDLYLNGEKISADQPPAQIDAEG